MSAAERLQKALDSGGPTMHLRDDLIDLLRSHSDLLVLLEAVAAQARALPAKQGEGSQFFQEIPVQLVEAIRAVIAQAKVKVSP